MSSITSSEGTLVLPRCELDRLKKAANNRAEQIVQFRPTIRVKNVPSRSQAPRRGLDADKIEMRKEKAEELAAVRREEALAARTARDEAAAREWRLHFWARDGIKQLHSALQLAQVLKERESQRSLNGAVTTRASEHKSEIQQREREEVKRVRENEKQRLAQLEKNRKLLRDALKQQMQEHEKARRDEEVELLQERQEMIKLYDEFCAEVKKNKAEAAAKQDTFSREFERTAEAARDEKSAQARFDQLEQRLCDLVLNSKHELRDLREEQKRQALEKRLEKRHRQAVNLFLKEEERMAKERERALKLEAEKSRKDREKSTARISNEIEKRRQALELQREQKQRAEEILMEQQRKVDSAEKEARRRHDHITRDFKQQQRQQLLETQAKNRKAYDQQTDELRRLAEEERVIEEATAARQQLAWELEDRQFMDYTHRVLKEAKHQGRPQRPLLKALEGYKKKCNIEHVTFVKDSMKSHLAIGLNTKYVDTIEEETVKY